MKYIFLIVFIIFLIFAIMKEREDHVLLYHNKLNIFENNTEKILENIKNNSCRNNTVYWRLSIIYSSIILFVYFMYNQLNNIITPIHQYFFVFILIYFTSYALRNFIAYHYDRHHCEFIIENIQKIKNKLTS
jgi:hypothetical protein